MSDLYVAIAITGFFVSALIIYLLRSAFVGRVRHARTEADGGSVFVNKTTMEMVYWIIDPMISFIALYRQELTTAMANLAATLEGSSSANTISGRASYLRAISMVSNESFYGQSVREPTNRHNTYFSPGELVNVGKGGLLSSDCANTANTAQVPLLGHNVACRTQPGYDWGNGIASGYFPRLTRATVPK